MTIRNDLSRGPPAPARTTDLRAPMLCLALASLGAAGAARADTVNLAYTGNGSGRVVHAFIGTQSWDVFAGRLLQRTSGANGQMAGMPSTIVTFCVDLLQTHSSIGSTFTRSSVALTSGNGGAQNLGYGKQQAIYDLYQAAAGRQFTAGLDYATAFQLAVWEVVYDYSATLPGHGLSVESGRFHATAPGQSLLTASIRDKVHFLLGSVGLGATAHGLLGLQSGPFQDQLYMPGSLVVPLPLAAWPALGGFGLLAMTQWRRKRA